MRQALREATGTHDRRSSVDATEVGELQVIRNQVLALARQYSFGPFELRTSPTKLLEDGHEIEIRSQILRVLELLVSRAGQIVSREEIRELLWGAEHSVEANRAINTIMTHLRKILGDQATDPTYVETVPSRGYRFVSAVSVIETPLISKTRVSGGARRAGTSVRSLLVWCCLALGCGVILGGLVADNTRSRVTSRPRVQVSTLKTVPSDERTHAMGESLTARLVSQLAADHAGEIDVVPADLDAGILVVKGGSATHVVLGRLSAESSGGYRLNLQLVAPDSYRILWAGVYRLERDFGELWSARAASDLVAALTAHGSADP